MIISPKPVSQIPQSTKNARVRHAAKPRYAGQIGYNLSPGFIRIAQRLVIA
jgi:hypothetical protein